MILYVASPYDTAPEVRELHKRLTTLGIAFTSMWAEQANGAEDFSKFSPEKLKDIAEENDAHVRAADAVLVLSRETGGRETYAEARYALSQQKHVFWVGKLTLSAWRDGVTRCENIDDALHKMTERCHSGSSLP
jgi:nucleoside 2-deoxyribosyltransferase